MLKTTFAYPRARRHLSSAAAALVLAACCALPSRAVRPEREHRADALRFGLDRVPGAPSRSDSRRVKEAIREFNASGGARKRLSFGPQGVGEAAAGAARRTVQEVVAQFLHSAGSKLGLSPEELRLETARTSGDLHHLLFQQVVEGVPVEFAKLKVHLTEGGEIHSLNSSIRGPVPAGGVPSVSETDAAAVVARDLGVQAPGGGTLVYYPVPGREELRLAWKFRAAGAGGSWIYYVDARDASLLFRYNDLRFQVCQTSGTVLGKVYDIDPNRAPGLVSRPIKNQKIYVVDASTFVLTNEAGFFCSGTPGRIHTTLQGPYASIAHFNGPNAHYQNGNGTWQTISTPLNSPHPYPNDATLISTITVPNTAVRVLPRFSTFDVGTYDSILGDIVDNDQVAILDAGGNTAATYIGNRAAFFAASVPGNRLNIRLKSNASGTRNGYEVNISSYLTLDNAVKSVPENHTATFTWSASHTHDATTDEINLFYHINLMHDYFRTRVTSGTNSAFLDIPVPVMARMGPNLANAFYDPVHKNLAFGDVGNGFALDATVVRHEYVHFAIDRIYPIVNFGQNGAISEALADYFAASSLGISSIGSFTQSALGGVGSLRDLDCPAQVACSLFPTNWSGLIHQDGLMISQSLWEIRKDLLASPPTPGPALDCADGLVYQALFFFPDSFQELLEAMLAVSARSSTLVPACGADNAQRGLILARFATHGISISASDEDVYEPNDGIQSATDITTAPVISARIFPQADLDYYAVGAGEGLMRFTLTLPESPGAPGNYFAYTMSLINSAHEIVAAASPPLDVNPTLSGFCPEPPTANCLTSAGSFTLTYDNPSSSQFYLAVTAPPGDLNLVTRNNSTRFYTLAADFNRTGPVAGSIVSASFDNDRFNFSVRVSSYLTRQNYSFEHAQLRDHALNAVSPTRTNEAGTYLTMISSTSQFGLISGSLRLQPGFAERFPAVGTVHLEIFGVNPLGRTNSFGFSKGINLTSDKSQLKAFNNVFNPRKGGKATIKYEIPDSGHVKLDLYTLSGVHVMNLLDEPVDSGKGAVDWNGVNKLGQTVASGVYLIHLNAPGVSETKKIVIVK